MGIPRGMRRLTLALAVVAASGCGGGGSAAAPPRLPHALGVELAAQADAVEASLARGDACGAAAGAERLRQAIAGAVAAGQVPAALRRPLSESADSLAAEIVCTPAPPATGPPDQGDQGPGHKPGHDRKRGHDHKHGHDHGGKD